MTTAKVVLGFDPGGPGGFGWAVLQMQKQDPPAVRACGCGDGARDVVAAAMRAARGDAIVAAGIDAPMFWSLGASRDADNRVRRAVLNRGGSSGTVQAVNSLRGACLAQGLLAAHLLRLEAPSLPITEAHPKAVLWHLGILSPTRRKGKGLAELDAANLIARGASQTEAQDEHVRDAVVSAVGAWAMVVGTISGWENIASIGRDDYTPLAPLPEYWMPQGMVASS